MQIREMHKLLREYSGAYLLPAVAAEFLAAMQTATAAQLKSWKVSKFRDIPSFLTGGAFLLAPVSIQTLCQVDAVLQGRANQKVGICQFTCLQIEYTCGTIATIMSSMFPHSCVELQVLGMVQFGKEVATAQNDAYKRIVLDNAEMLLAGNAAEEEQVTIAHLREWWG
jgi:hypothetical protein